MNLHLRDKNPAVVEAWRQVFDDTPNVTISEGDILDLDGDAIVSPANSFGWMDGGIDLAYRERFGRPIESILQTAIREMLDGELPVGSALCVMTLDDRIPWMIAAPTMRVPGPVPGTCNAYLAMRAATLKFKRKCHDKPAATLLCPGLATLTGRMSPRQAAVQMRWGWHVAAELSSPPSPSMVMTMHRDMLASR